MTESRESHDSQVTLHDRHIRESEQHITRAELRICRQERLILELTRSGRDLAQATVFLQLLNDTLFVMKKRHGVLMLPPD